MACPKASIAYMREALRRVRLLDWVDDLPNGLHTMVGERGAQISGGQRRRLALARALLADFSILVLDEPTEHLDAATAAAITADLLDAAGERGVLLITHQPFGLDRMDEVRRQVDEVRHLPAQAASQRKSSGHSSPQLRVPIASG